MTNNKYFEELDKYILSLQELRAEGITIAKGIIGENLTKEDLFFCATLDRCFHLINGLILLLKERNLTCAGPLLRLQMDNCMRTYSVYIAKNKTRVIDCLIYGTPIKDEKDTKGNKMYDSYLKNSISLIDNHFDSVYNQASGYIHLSEKAFYQTVTDITKDGVISFQIGQELPEKMNEPLLECAKAFCHFVKLHYKLLYPVVESKKIYDANYNKN